MILRALQLRSALLRARHQTIRAAGACALALLIAGCGGSGSESADTNNDGGPLPITVSGADNASVSLRALDSARTEQVTVRVARDGSGAPALGQGYQPLGAIYQFTPLGWMEEAIEIRIPFTEEAAGQPRLLIALPGGEWAEVSDAKRDGNFLSARVPHLAYATVAVLADASTTERVKALVAGGTGTTQALTLSFDTKATTPSLPAPSSDGSVKVTVNTNLALQLKYGLPSGCTIAPKLTVYAQVWQPATQTMRTVQLGERLASGIAGAVSYSVPLSSSDKGTWTFNSTAACKDGLFTRYSIVAAGPSLTVDIVSSPTAPPPVITTQPKDVNAVDGDPVQFSVVAQGQGLAYAWLRNSGPNDATVPGATAASLNFKAALADNGTLFSARVSNANGAVVSTPARLTVSAKVIAPAITSNPANQSVTEGQTASFSVAGSGTPAPTIQWQQRSAASADPQAGWADIANSTTATYTTAATTLAQSGRQFRAVLRNAAGVVNSSAATLTVNAGIVAPTITSQPTAREAFAGEFGVFTVTAAGTSPLSYQWFKNDQALVGENAAQLRLYADPADVGRLYQVRVRISNNAGALNSVTTTLTVQPPGTRVVATEGGTVAGANGVSLDVPPGALSSDVTIAVVSESLAAGALPVGVIALSDVVEIKPTGLRFATPTALSFTVSQQIPSGMALAFIDPSSGNAVPGARRLAELTNSTAPRDGPRILAQAQIAAITLPSNLACRSVQDISAAGTFKLSSITSAVRGVVVAVPEAACSSISALPLSGSVPVDTTNACDRDSQFGFVGAKAPAGLTDEESSLLNRHVDCRAAESTDDYVWADMLKNAAGELTGTVASASADPATTESVQVASVRFEFQVSTAGPSTSLGKSVRYRARAVKYDQAGLGNYKGPARPDVYLRAQPSCYTVADGPFAATASASCNFTPQPIRVAAGGSWSQWADMPVRINWVNAAGNPYDMAFFRILLATFQTRIAGSDDQFRRPGARQPYSIDSTLGTLPVLRCDRGLAKVSTEGCVFPQAAAVYLLDRADRTVKEAAEHVFEAQTGPLQSPGNYLPKPGTRAIGADSGNALQRAKSETVQDENRKRSCRLADSLIKTRIPTNQSAKCAANSQVCECDEYPFASTWNGGAFSPARTSAKMINGAHNQAAGSGNLTNFYTSQRVLDFTQYPEQVQPYDPTVATNRGGDNFWVVAK
jgi:ZU5 domain